MPSKDPIERFADIVENIILIEEFTRGMDLNAYQEDLKTRNANRGQWWSNFVPLFRGPTCVPWETSYDTNTTESNPGRVWVMIEDDLGPLKAASQRALDRLRQAEEEQ